jgi:hypothetical protein
VSYETPRRLISLACPIIINPCLEIANDEVGLYEPPFPLINLLWDGFTISHLHWVGINHTNHERWGYPIRHECCHGCLAVAPFSRLKKRVIFSVYSLIYKTFEKRFNKGRKLIQVPVIPHTSGNTLQKHFNIIALIHDASMLVEEVYAVRSSLVDARNEGLILHEEVRNSTAAYKEKYGKHMSEFPDAYDRFDIIADKLGKTATQGLIFSVLGTLNPTKAFLDLLSGLCGHNPRVSTNGSTKNMWNIDDEHTDWMANLSFEEAYSLFSALSESSDPDDSVYRRKDMEKMYEELCQEQSLKCYNVNDDFFNSLFGEPEGFLFCEYSSYMHPFEERPGTIEVPYGNFFVLLEAIMQQLMQGNGLLCPFWVYGLGCCSHDNKALLENIWSSTSPTRSCTCWERLGCLQERKCGTFNAKRSKH